MIAVLHDEEVESLERLPQRSEVGERDDRIGGDDPERADASIEGSFDNVGIRQSASGRNALLADSPECRQLAAILGVFELAIAGQARSKPGLARTHRVA